MMEKKEMNKKSETERGEDVNRREKQHPPPNISPMEPVNLEAYGGGMYGKDPGPLQRPRNRPASETQSADGEAEPLSPPMHRTLASTGNRDVDITGQSYIQ